MRLLMEANNRNDELVDKLREAEISRDDWRQSYWDIYGECSRLRSQLECVDCQQKSKQTPDGKTVESCCDCSEIFTDWKKKAKELKEKVEYWESCYETLLAEHFKDDRRNYDGAQS